MRYSRDEYRHGDSVAICDRSGFKVHHSDTRVEWNGFRVRKEDWEPRQPQDFLKGIPDNQAVEDPRPGAGDTFSETETTLDADEAAGQTVLSVTSTASMANGDTVIIFLDNEGTHLSTILSFVADDTMTINSALPSKAASGNKVVITSNPTTAASL